MARTDLLDSAAATSFPLGGANFGAAPMKRKTPSELREEQLKRKMTKKYIDTRVSEVYPVKKSSERCHVPTGKEKVKDILADGKILKDQDFPSTVCGFPGNRVSQPTCDKTGKLNSFECSNPFAKDDQGSHKNEMYNQRNVTELHLGKKLSDSPKIDMEKALKGLATRHVSVKLVDSSGEFSALPSVSGDLHSEFSITGHKPPLDFTLKTTLRLVSSSSVKWCHRLNASLGTIGSNRFTSQLSPGSHTFGCKSGVLPTNEVLYSKALNSWLYPQSSLPSSIISAMTLSSTTADSEFLDRRQHDWETSFQNLYYMLRKSLCNIFYVCTSQFVVLFVGGFFLGKKKWSCNGYISKSTRGLRTLLRKHDISFTMPLCRVEAEQATNDDLGELSEIEKQKLGQTFRLDPMSDVDNSHQSLLAFVGNENVHSLYDFLLNYRFFLPSLTGVDVPVLYAPVPFQNASLRVPEVRCKEMKRADVVPSSSGSGSETEGSVGSAGLSSSGICYSIEIKDTLLPPWVVSGLCAAMGSDGRSFEASFTTDPSSLSLNVALDSASQKSSLPIDLTKSSGESGEAFGIRDAALDPCLQSAYLRQLNYSNDCYVAHAARI